MAYYRSVIQDSRREAGQGNVVGMIAILVAMIDLVAQVAAAAFCGQGYLRASHAAGTTDFDVNDPSIAVHTNQFGFSLLAWILAWGISLIPFVLGIIGAVHPPRTMGITAIVISVLAPVLSFLVLLFWIMPASG